LAVTRIQDLACTIHLSLVSGADRNPSIKSQSFTFGGKINFQPARLPPLRPNHFKISTPSLTNDVSVSEIAIPLGNRRSIWLAVLQRFKDHDNDNLNTLSEADRRRLAKCGSS
jgi:hypothetical protein